MINWTKHWLEQSTSSHAGDLKKKHEVPKLERMEPYFSHINATLWRRNPSIDRWRASDDGSQWAAESCSVFGQQS